MRPAPPKCSPSPLTVAPVPNVGLPSCTVFSESELGLPREQHLKAPYCTCVAEATGANAWLHA